MTERYYIEAARDGWDIMDGDAPIRDTDITARLNEQDDDIQRLRADVARLRAACKKALHFHNRYCDRVGAADGWATAVHQALRDAVERAAC